MHRREFLAVSAGSTLLASARADEKATIKIVSSLPRSGDAAVQTDAIVRGILMALLEYEKQLPFEVGYEDLDDAKESSGRWDGDIEASNARSAARDDQVVALIGPYNSGAAKVSMPILNRAGLVQISPATSWTGLTRKAEGTGSDEPDIYRPTKKSTFCRICPFDHSQGQLAAWFALKDLKAKAVYVLDDGESYGKSCAGSFAAECKNLSIKVLGRESLEAGSKDHRQLLAKVKKTEPDALYFGGTTRTGGPEIAKAFAASELKGPLILPDGCRDDAFIKAAGADVLNGRCYITMNGFEPALLTGRGAAFIKKYRAKFGKPPDAYILYGFEAAVVILEAIKTAGQKDREAIRKAVLATKDFDKGVLGPWSFDAHGDTTLQQITVSRVANGVLVPVKLVRAEAAPQASVTEKKTITIVSSLPRRGSAKAATDAIVNSITLALSDYAKQLPFVVKLEDLDSSAGADGYWDAKTEAQNARQAIKDEDVMAYIGPYNSGAAKISMPLLNTAGMVQISPATTWPGLTKPMERGEPEIYRPKGIVTFCRVCPTDDIQGPLAALFVARDLQAGSVYILDDGEFYGKESAAKLFAKACAKEKIKVLGHESIDLTRANYRDLMDKIKKTEPEALYFGGTTQSKAPQIARDLAASGMKCPLIVPDACYESAFIEAAGAEALNGRCYVTMGGLDMSRLTGKGADYVKRYKEKFGKEPEAYALYGYEAAAVVLEAIKKAGAKDREAIRKAVLATKDFDQGLLGKWSFDANGDTTLQEITVSKVEKGKFVSLKTLKMVSP